MASRGNVLTTGSALETQRAGDVGRGGRGRQRVGREHERCGGERGRSRKCRRSQTMTTSLARWVPRRPPSRAGGPCGYIENLRHTRDVAHPWRCQPPTIRVLSRELVRVSVRDLVETLSGIYGSSDHSHPNTSRSQEG
eukprot:1427141-Pyramimonas_sp.AAC.1